MVSGSKQQVQQKCVQKGWLLRWTRKQWSRHWFVLKNGSITYYRGPAAELCSFLDGVLDLSLIKHIQVPQLAEESQAADGTDRPDGGQAPNSKTPVNNHNHHQAFNRHNQQQQSQQHHHHHHLSQAANTGAAQAGAPGAHFEFTLKMWNGECHLLGATSAAERQSWLAAINSCTNFEDETATSDSSASSDSSSSSVSSVSLSSNLSAESTDISVGCGELTMSSCTGTGRGPANGVQSRTTGTGVTSASAGQQTTLGTSSHRAYQFHQQQQRNSDKNNNSSNNSYQSQQQQQREADISLEHLALKLKSIVRRTSRRSDVEQRQETTDSSRRDTSELEHKRQPCLQRHTNNNDNQIISSQLKTTKAVESANQLQFCPSVRVAPSGRSKPASKQLHQSQHRVHNQVKRGQESGQEDEEEDEDDDEDDESEQVENEQRESVDCQQQQQVIDSEPKQAYKRAGARNDSSTSEPKLIKRQGESCNNNDSKPLVAEEVSTRDSPVVMRATSESPEGDDNEEEEMLSIKSEDSSSSSSSSTFSIENTIANCTTEQKLPSVTTNEIEKDDESDEQEEEEEEVERDLQQQQQKRAIEVAHQRQKKRVTFDLSNQDISDYSRIDRDLSSSSSSSCSSELDEDGKDDEPIVIVVGEENDDTTGRVFARSSSPQLSSSSSSSPSSESSLSSASSDEDQDDDDDDDEDVDADEDDEEEEEEEENEQKERQQAQKQQQQQQQGDKQNETVTSSTVGCTTASEEVLQTTKNTSGPIGHLTSRYAPENRINHVDDNDDDGDDGDADADRHYGEDGEDGDDHHKHLLLDFEQIKQIELKRKQELKRQLSYSKQKENDEDEDSTCELVRRMIERRKSRLLNRITTTTTPTTTPMTSNTTTTTTTTLLTAAALDEDGDATMATSADNHLTSTLHSSSSAIGSFAMETSEEQVADCENEDEDNEHDRVKHSPAVDSSTSCCDLELANESMGEQEDQHQQRQPFDDIDQFKQLNHINQLEDRLKSAQFNVDLLEKRLNDSYLNYNQLEVSYKQLQLKLLECQQMHSNSLLQTQRKIDDLTQELKTSELNLLEAKKMLQKYEEHLAKWQLDHQQQVNMIDATRPSGTLMSGSTTTNNGQQQCQSSSNSNDQIMNLSSQNSHAKPTASAHKLSSKNWLIKNSLASSNYYHHHANNAHSNSSSHLLALHDHHHHQPLFLMHHLKQTMSINQQQLSLKLLSQSRQIQRKLNELEIKVDKIQSSTANGNE